MSPEYIITSTKIKAALVKHLRFERQKACVSEFSPMSLRDREDVATLDINMDGIKQLDVYEIKISYSDFKSDFRKQKHKKMPYSRFIYVVEPHMAEKCEQYLKEHFPDYGLMTFDYNPTYKMITGFKTIIRAKSDNKTIDKDDERMFYLRMSSMASQCLEKEERIENLLGQNNILRQDANHNYQQFRNECESSEMRSLKRRLNDSLNTILSFDDILNGSDDLPHRYKEILQKEKYTFDDIKKLFEYCKGSTDFKKIEEELNCH